VGSVLLPYAPASVAVARRRLAADLTAAGIFAGAVGDAVLVVSELLSNAIRHARPLPGASVQVAWVLADDAVEVAVSDGGAPTRPTTAQATVSSLGGRGLDIVEYLARTWGVRTDAAGITVWAILAAPPDRHRPTATREMAPLASHAARRNSEPDWLYLSQRVRSGGPAGSGLRRGSGTRGHGR
jgi:anti-sigma regulatory factor (Ser/Thr protein kinase)